MTTPWNTWIRERLPSVTRTWTLSVSPGRKSGMSDRVWACSISAIAVCMTAVPRWWSCTGQRGYLSSRPHARKDGDLQCAISLPLTGKQAVRGKHLTVPGVQFECPDEVGPVRGGPAQRHVPPPAGDRGVVAGKQHFGDLVPAPGPRPGVDRAFQQAAHRAARAAAAERVVARRAGIAQHPGQQPPDRLDHDQHRGLAAGQHVVADAHLVHRHLRAHLVGHARVDALVAPAREDQPRRDRIARRHRLGKRHPAGGGDDQPRRILVPVLAFVLAGERDHVVKRGPPDIGLHHHPRTAAERHVVDGVVHVGGPRPQVVDVEFDVAALRRLADQRRLEWPAEVFGEDRHDVDAHYCASSESSRPGGGSMTSTPPATSTSGTSGATNGTSRSSAPSALLTRRSWPWCRTSVTTPTSSPAPVRTERPTSSWSRNSSGSVIGGSTAESTLSQVPPRSAAAVRSAIPSNATSSCPECQRFAATVSSASGVPSLSRPAPSRAPVAKRRSGSSVLTPTTTSPRIPCGRPMRPTITRMGSADLVRVQQVDANVTAPRQRPDHGAECAGGAPAPADDLAEVIGMHPDLKDVAATQ